MTERVNELASLLASVRDSFKGELLDKINEVDVSRFLGEDINDLLSDLLDLGMLSVRCLSDLSGLSSGEGDNIDSQNIAISCLDFTVDFNKGLPLSKIRTKLISGHIQTMEVSQTGSSLDFLNAESDFSPGQVFRLVI